MKYYYGLLSCLCLWAWAEISCAYNFDDNQYWRCTDRHGQSTVSDKVCPVGMQALAVDANNQPHPEILDPFANKQFLRCTAPDGTITYPEQGCMIGSKSEFVNREGFSPDELDAQQKRQAKAATKIKAPPPTNNPDFFVPKPMTEQEKECKGWRSANLIDPSQEKQNFIEKHCPMKMSAN